ncbi:MAG: hypothetical protein J5663_11055 [Bacteroidaceae bacterium]|nr:hypothetical protein [Bacteroidaceae bacterium]
MKTIKYLAAMAAVLTLGAGVTSCSDDDDDNVPAPVANKGDYHFDLLVSVGGTTGMSSTGVTATLVRSVDIDALSNPDTTISMKGIGADITADINSEAIIKGAYYYEASPLKNTWYGKYQVSNTGVNNVTRYEFATNTFLTRQYTHAWTSDNSLVILGANRSVSRKSKYADNTIMWTRLADSENILAIVDEGTLDLTEATKSFREGGVTAFCTSGLATYRKADNTIIYAFTDAGTDAEAGFYIAFIDAKTMEVKHVCRETRVDEMAGTAYGELQQDKMFFDENGDLYIACGTKIPNAEKDAQQYGSLVRVKNGEYTTDQTYLGLGKVDNGKILTAEYIGNGKCALYVTNPVKAGLISDMTVYDNGWGQNAFNSYYYIYDIASDKFTELTYNGETLPASCGSFTDRVAVFNNKAYLGVNPDEAKYGSPRIYVYDVNTGAVSLGARIEGGYYFNRLSVVKNK